MTNTFQSGFVTTTSRKINPSDTTILLKVAPTITKGRIYISNSAQEEWISYDGITGNELQNCVRWLSKTATPATAGTGLTWIAGTKVKFVAMHDQLLDKQNDQTMTAKLDFGTNQGRLAFPKFTTTQRDAILTWSDGEVIHNTTDNVLQQRLAGSWVDIGDAGTPLGSETVAGKFELATAAQRWAGTSVWETWARLIPSNDALVKTSAGAADQNKIPLLWPDGKIDWSMLPATVYQQVVLWENMTAWELWFHINNSGGKLYKYLGYKGTRVNTTGWTTSASSFTIDANTKVQAISTDKFVMLYNTRNGSFDQVVAVVWTLSNQTITFGTPTNITGISNVLQSINICEIDTDKFVVVRKASSSFTIETNVCTVSGTTITVWATQTAITTSGTFATVEVSKVDTNKFAVFSDANTRQMVCATVSGTTATFWSVITPTITCQTLAQATANKIVWSDGTNIRIYTISGTTITEQANFAIGTGYWSPSLCNYSTTSSYLVFSGTNGSNTEAFIVDASGTTAAKGTTLTVVTGTWNNMCAKSIISDVVVASGTINTHLSVTGTTLSIRKVITLTDAVIWYKSVAYIGIRNIVSCLWNKTTNPWAWSHNNTKNYILWLLQETGTTWETKNVACSWSPSTVQSWLTVAEYIYASNSDWSLSNVVSDVFIWPSISATRLFVSIPYNTL